MAFLLALRVGVVGTNVGSVVGKGKQQRKQKQESLGRRGKGEYVRWPSSFWQKKNVRMGWCGFSSSVMTVAVICTPCREWGSGFRGLRKERWGGGGVEATTWHVRLGRQPQRQGNGNDARLS